MKTSVAIRGLIFVTCAIAVVTVTKSAQAQSKDIPAGNGLAPMRLHVDLGAGELVIERCAATPCATERVAMGVDRSKLAGTATIEAVPIGDGRTVAHVRVPLAEEGRAWEAIVAGREGGTIFAGFTGYFSGEEGERSGAMIRLLDGPNGAKIVVVADVREDLRICGQSMTPLSPRGLDPKTLQLRGATLQRLSADERAKATRIIASAHAGSPEPPLAKLLVATGGSARGVEAVTDGNPGTAWHEERPGDGHGEFVTMRAPPEVAIDRLAIVMTPAVAAAPVENNGSAVNPAGNAIAKSAPVAPRTFFLAMGDHLFAVTMPEDAAMHPGAAYEIPLPEPVATSCVSIVLDDAYAHGNPTPEVTIAELYAYSRFDHAGATTDEVAHALEGGANRAQAAAALLSRAGTSGAAAADRAFDALDPAGRALAIDVAVSAGTCEESGGFFARALGDKDREVVRKAREKLERCGKSAGPALIAALANPNVKVRTSAAEVLAVVSPSTAVEPLAGAVSDPDARVRASMRKALAYAARSVSPEIIARVVSAERPVATRVDVLRAIAPRLPDARAEATKALAEVSPAGADLRTRYLTLAPLASLAAVDANELAHLTREITADPDWPVRARAVEVAGPIAGARNAIVTAATDPSPRVREAALRSLADAHAPEAVRVAWDALDKDDWPFVRTQAAAALASSPPDARVDTKLASALADPSPRVRAALLEGLASRGASSQTNAIRGRAMAKDEALEVRVAAIRALGHVCAKTEADDLTGLASHATLPAADDAELQLAFASVEALGRLHPADLETRLAKLRQPGVRAQARAAADAALAETETCK